MTKHYLIFFVCSSLFLSKSTAQEITEFQLQDFDLRGNVKTCQVITDYGQEIFEFDALGKLVKTTTQYNEEDWDITVYKFVGDELVEKRVESYKNNEIDLSSSMVHFYTIDSTENKKVKEQIISYDKEFVEAQEYQFDDNGKLFKIIVSHENAVDETQIERTSYKNENTTTYFENGVIQKSIRESTKKHRTRGDLKVVLTKNYLDGEPHTAEENMYDQKGLLVSKENFQYDKNQAQFASYEKHFYDYNEEGIRIKETIKLGNTIASKEFIFQFDDNEEKNWVKKITTPDNTFITRRLEYYPKALANLEEPD